MILVDKNTRYCIQGITGKQGTRACETMLAAGSNVVAGVTPGKGGQYVHGVPVYNSMNEVDVDCTVIYVPPRFAKAAMVEAIEAGVKLIVVVTENVPVHDTAYCYALAQQYGARIIGPSSVGVYSVGASKCGSIASGKSQISFSPGPVGIISRSGGMCSETALGLTQAGIGQSTVVGIGSDIITGSTMLDILKLFEADDDTKVVVLYGEIGGDMEENVARHIKEHGYRKPVVAFIAGKFASQFEDISLGHAGAIIEGDSGKWETKVKLLKEAGVHVVHVHHDIVGKVKELL